MIRKKYSFIVFGILLLIFFYLFSWEVKNGRFKTINFDTTARLQSKIPARFDEIFEDLSFFVSPTLSIFFIGLLTIAAFIDVKKKRVRWLAIVIPLAFAALVGVEVYGKDRVESPAPPYFMIKNPTTIFPKYHVIDQYSYPSGHATRSLFFAGVLTLIVYIKTKNLKFTMFSLIVSLSYCLIVSLGKVYLGQHWLSDIIGGWILSSAFLCFVYGIYHE